VAYPRDCGKDQLVACRWTDFNSDGAVGMHVDVDGWMDGWMDIRCIKAVVQHAPMPVPVAGAQPTVGVT
jgi:hypothetical protein